MPNNKNKSTKSRKPRKLPYYLRHSFTNLFNRASEEFGDNSESSDQSDNLDIEEVISEISAGNKYSSSKKFNPRSKIQSNHLIGKNSLSVDSISFNNSISIESKIMSQPNEVQLPSASAAAAAAVANGANMAATATQVFNCLKIPDAVKDLPKFDGNPRLLHDFIDNVEEILSLISDVDGTLYSKILLRAIRNKIEGPANEVLNMYGTPLEWGHIKKNLILHYSDERNETSLIRDLHGLKQFNKSVEKYYSEIIELQATMFNHIQIHEVDSNVIRTKRNLFAEMCLNTFLTGLREPLGSTVRAMRPESLPVAFSYCIKEQNIAYAKNEPHIQVRPKQNFSRPNIQQQPRNFPSRQVSQIQPINFSSRPFNQQQPTDSSSVRQAYFQIPQNRDNFNQQPRPFAPNPYNRPNLPKPEPMDTSSGNTHLRQQTRYQPPRFNNYSNFNNNFNQNNQQPRFTSKELFNINERNLHEDISDDNIYPNNNYYANLDRFYNYGNNQNNKTRSNSQRSETQYNFELDDTNFHIAGPTNPLDT